MARSRQSRPLASAAFLVVALLCVALLAVTSPTAVAAAAGLADTCGKLATPSANAAAAEECRKLRPTADLAGTCYYMTRQYTADVGESLATAFTTLATGDLPRWLDAAVAACALLAREKSSLAAACEAARDALAQSDDAAFADLCKASFNALPPGPPSPPPPAPLPPPSGPCGDNLSSLYKSKCLDLFSKGTSEFFSIPDDVVAHGDCPTLLGPTYPCTASVRPPRVTKDCCNIISQRCLCDLREQVFANTKGGSVPHCFENMKCE